MPMRAYIDGADVLTFKTEALEVELAAYLVDKMYGPGKEVNLHLQLKNTEDVPVDFNPSKMVAYMIKKGMKVEVDVYSASDYLFKVDNSIIWYGPSNEETMTSTTTVKGRDGRTIKSVNQRQKDIPESAMPHIWMRKIMSTAIMSGEIRYFPDSRHPAL